MDRSTFIKAMVPDMHEWYWESADPFYKTHKPLYPKYMTVKPLSEISGSFAQMTSAIAVGKLPKKPEGADIQTFHAAEGFTVYIAKQRFYGLSDATFELDADFPKVKNFIRDYIKANMPEAIMNTKEDLATGLFNYGGVILGHEVFNNATKNNTPAYGSLLYDSVCFFNLADNLRTAKNGSTFYNGLASSLTGANAFANLKAAHTLFTATNAKKENGEPFDNSQNKLLMVPQALELDADVLINSTLIPGSNNHDKNPLKGAYEIVVNPRMTTATSWSLLRAAGLIMYETSDPDFDFFEDKKKKQLVATFGTTVAIGVKNFRTAVGSNFATTV